jgi:hypothetical protein
VEKLWKTRLDVGTEPLQLILGKGCCAKLFSDPTSIEAG